MGCDFNNFKREEIEFQRKINLNLKYQVLDQEVLKLLSCCLGSLISQEEYLIRYLVDYFLYFRNFGICVMFIVLKYFLKIIFDYVSCMIYFGKKINEC